LDEKRKSSAGKSRPKQVLKHINLLEILAIQKSILAFQLRNSFLLIKSDKTVAVRAVNRKGSLRSIQVQVQIGKLFKVVKLRKIQLKCYS